MSRNAPAEKFQNFHWKWSQVGHSWLKQQIIKRCAPPLFLLKVAPKDGASCEDLQICHEQNHRAELLCSTRWVTEWSKQRSFKSKAEIFSCRKKSVSPTSCCKKTKCPTNSPSATPRFGKCVLLCDHWILKKKSGKILTVLPIQLHGSC